MDILTAHCVASDTLQAQSGSKARAVVDMLLCQYEWHEAQVQDILTWAEASVDVASPNPRPSKTDCAADECHKYPDYSQDRFGRPMSC